MQDMGKKQGWIESKGQNTLYIFSLSINMRQKLLPSFQKKKKE